MGNIRNEGVKVRPFEGAEKAEEALSQSCSLKVVSGSMSETLRDRHKIHISSAEISTAGKTLIFENLAELKRSVGYMADSSNVDVLVVALEGPASPERRADVLFRCGLDELPDNIPLSKIGERPSSRSLMGTRWGVDIELACVLNKTLEKRPLLKPKDKGALIAKVAFSIKPSGLSEGFNPQMLTDEIRENEGLEEGSWIYVRVNEGMVTPDSDLESALEVFIDEEMMGNRSVAEPLAKGIFDHLIVSSVFHAMFVQSSLMIREMDEVAELHSTPLGRILRKRFGANSGEKLDDALELLREEPNKLASNFLAGKSISNGLGNLLKEAAND